jgi:hypothetical protein
VASGAVPSALPFGLGFWNGPVIGGPSLFREPTNAALDPLSLSNEDEEDINA